VLCMRLSDSKTSRANCCWTFPFCFFCMCCALCLNVAHLHSCRNPCFMHVLTVCTDRCGTIWDAFQLPAQGSQMCMVAQAKRLRGLRGWVFTDLATFVQWGVVLHRLRLRAGPVNIIDSPLCMSGVTGGVVGALICGGAHKVS
jgi:hypothetical protein